MNSPFLYTLNEHFARNIACHPVVKDDDFRQSSLMSFNEALNKYKPSTEEEKAIANFFRNACTNNLRCTLEYLKRLNLIGLTQFIGGHCMALALGVDNKLYIAQDANGVYTAGMITARRAREGGVAREGGREG